MVAGLDGFESGEEAGLVAHDAGVLAHGFADGALQGGYVLRTTPQRAQRDERVSCEARLGNVGLWAMGRCKELASHRDPG